MTLDRALRAAGPQGGVLPPPTTLVPTPKPGAPPGSISAAQIPPSTLVSPDGEAVHVIHLVAELAPYARTGGLGEAVSSLARFQAASGLPTTIIMPLYGPVRQSTPQLEPVGPAYLVQVGPRAEEVRLWRPVSADAAGESAAAAAAGGAASREPKVYFVESAEYFDRPFLYGPPDGDYFDNARRYACFAMAALAAIPRLAGSAPVLLHAHDWHSALAPVYLRTLLAGDTRFSRTKTVLTVHNAGHQGHFPDITMPDVGLPWSLFNWRELEWYGEMNFLKGGMAFADAVTTVSPTHAHELRTPAGGFGLDGAFRGLRDRFVGIANGIDQQQWDPATDPLLAANFSADAIQGKRRCRKALQREMKLRAVGGVPIFAMSARLVSQKGLDLILGDPGYFALDAQFVFLGAGEPRYEEALTAIAERAPSRIAVQLHFTEEMEHRLLAGADMCFMPSQYEPCGLTQMRSQRYGTIPVARRVGGLADTIEDGVTGFLFDDYTADDFVAAVMRAVDQYSVREGWRHMVSEAMRRDFGWEQSAAKYLAVYQRVMRGMPAAR